MTWLLCVYLIFKGVEIFQIALARVSRGVALVVGGLALLASLTLAAWLAITIDEQAKQVSSQMHSPLSP